MEAYFQESEALTSPPNGWGGKTSSIASGKNSRAKSSSITSQTPNSMETSENSTRQITLDELISLAGDSLANHIPSQGNDLEKKTNAICGRRCLELFESVHRVGSWERTFAGLLIGQEGWFSKRCALTWKLVGTPFNRLFFQLAPSTLPTDATEFGLLLTPTTSEQVQDLDKFKTRMEKYPNGTTMPNLATQVIGMLPTPTTRDYKGARSEEALEAVGRNETNSLPDAFAQSGKTSQLNPRFVAEMMGFPENWTELPFLSGEPNQSKHTETQ